jgi:hypothetical protein
VDLVYSASSNLRDPVGPASINTTSFNGPGIFKSNFWEITDSGNTQGALGYASLYPSVLAVGLDSLCDPNPAIGCPSVLTAAFDPIPGDLGIPVPDPAHLPGLVVGQQAMPSAVNHAPFITSPYSANEPQPFDRFDVDLPFFTALPIGTTVLGVNWFAADGIPMLPVDDLGQSNAYPLMKVLAISKGTPPHITNNVLASTEVVLPVASEADCQGCHADPADLGNGAAANFASVSNYADGTPWEVMLTADAPGPEPLLNAAKINVLRLHDTKHGANYTSSVDASPLPCTSGSEVSCLDVRRNIQCSQCHYSPALDLAQIGPVDEPEQGIHGRQQTRHISMSRAMHGHHGEFTDLFPEMPAPSDPARTPELQAQVLQESCYQCHPGKRTQCLRGAMASGGVVCQDCHGNMKQVGNDFSKGLPGGTGLDLTRRVPWANEPQCQACHIGDVLTIAQADTSDFELAVDGIRLRQTYRKSDAMAASLPFISAPGSRFAEDQGLYRLSKGHGGVMCEGCHGSTYAIWPVQPDGDDVNSPFLANDNLAAIGLQGHTGTITECDTCHAPGSLGLTLDGPHGMHPVNNPNWTHRHESVAEQNPDSCRACHGSNGEGSVLARTADLRILESHDKQPDGSKQITLSRGTEVSCTLCHENKL